MIDNTKKTVRKGQSSLNTLKGSFFQSKSAHCSNKPIRMKCTLLERGEVVLKYPVYPETIAALCRELPLSKGTLPAHILILSQLRH